MPCQGEQEHLAKGSREAVYNAKGSKSIMPRGAAKRYTMSRGASTSHQGEPRSGSTMLTVWWSDSGTCGSHQLKKLRASKRSNMDSFAVFARHCCWTSSRSVACASHRYRRFRYRSTRRLFMICRLRRHSLREGFYDEES